MEISDHQTDHITERMDENVITLHPKQKTRKVTHNRTRYSIYISSTEELMFLIAERGPWGIMLSELDELGKMIYKRCIKDEKVVEIKGVIYLPPQTEPCVDEDFRKFWIESSQVIV